MVHLSALVLLFKFLGLHAPLALGAPLPADLFVRAFAPQIPTIPLPSLDGGNVPALSAPATSSTDVSNAHRAQTIDPAVQHFYYELWKAPKDANGQPVHRWLRDEPPSDPYAGWSPEEVEEWKEAWTDAKRDKEAATKAAMRQQVAWTKTEEMKATKDAVRKAAMAAWEREEQEANIARMGERRISLPPSEHSVNSHDSLDAALRDSAMAAWAKEEEEAKISRMGERKTSLPPSERSVHVSSSDQIDTHNVSHPPTRPPTSRANTWSFFNRLARMPRKGKGKAKE